MGNIFLITIWYLAKDIFLVWLPTFLGLPKAGIFSTKVQSKNEC